MTRTPPAIATSPTAIAGATSGTTARLTAGARIASRPNETRTTGSVAAWAASDTPRLSASQRGTRPWPIDSIQSVNGVAQAIRPAVASDESWNPASAMSLGSARRRSTAAQPSAAAARPARPVSRASRTTPAIRAARTTDADAPANATYAAMASIVTTERRRRPSRPANGRDGRRHDRDVPARDGDDVTHPGRGERRREVAVDPVAQADQDAGREAGLGFRQDPGSWSASRPWPRPATWRRQFTTAGVSRIRRHLGLEHRDRRRRPSPRSPDAWAAAALRRHDRGHRQAIRRVAGMRIVVQGIRHVVLLAREAQGRAAAALGWAAVLLLLADPRLIADAGFFRLFVARRPPD